MKRILVTIVAVACYAMSGGAQSGLPKTKMSPWLQQQYVQEQQAVKKNGGPRHVQGRTVRKYMLTLVKSTDEATAVRRQDGVVMQDFGEGICAAFLPIDRLGELSHDPNILRLEANAPAQLLNDTCAQILKADKAWKPSSPLPQAYTGKGVVAAVMDIGFDFTHPAFRHDNGTSRIKWFWDPMAPDATTDMLGMVYSSPNEVLAARHSMNADKDNHGTHVLGSMAGDGLDGHYAGMAPEADIMGAYIPLGSVTQQFLDRVNDYMRSHLADYPGIDDLLIDVEFTDVFELIELYNIFKAADAIGEPCVVNWSFGSGVSFLYDGTLYEEVFNRLVGPGHIVVTSAGNSGYNKSYLKKEAGVKMDQDVYYITGIDGFAMYMRTEPDEPPFTFGLTFDGIADTLFVNTADIAALQGDTLFVQSPELEIQFVASPGAYNKTVYQTIIYPTESYASTIMNGERMTTHGKVIVDKQAQVELLGLVNSKVTVRFSTESLTNSRGCQIGTIGAPAHMERIITVGAMHQRNELTNIQGQRTSYKYIGSDEGHLASFSSCGPTIDGRIKPDVVAPGHNIISCLNSFYLKDHNQEATAQEVLPLTAYASNAFGEYYAMWAMSGTSMSSPVTAGVVALWLQADPTLTPEDIKAIIQRTSHQPEPEFSGTDKNIYYGWGEIDAYAGLLDILGIEAALPELPRYQPAGVSFRLSGNTLYIDGADDGTPVTIYDLSGRPVFRAVTDGSAIRLPALPAAVYAVQLGQAGSTLIRIN